MSGSSENSSSSPGTRERSPPRGRPHHQRDDSDGPRKEKKRVGFTGGFAADEDSQPPVAAPEGEYFPAVLSPVHSPGRNPFDTPQPTGDNGPEPAELHRALSKVLVTEADGTGHSGGEGNNGSGSGGGDIAHLTPSPSGLGRPRPALRRNTSYDVPAQQQEADEAESRATPRQQKSGAEARKRADRLAVSVESWSTPPSPSRRGSTDLTQPPMTRAPIPEHDETDLGNPHGGLRGIRDQHGADQHGAVATGIDTAPAPDETGQMRTRSRRKYRQVAENLVRTHTKRFKKGDEQEDLFRFRREEVAPSRPGTPTDEKAYADEYADEYVPRPEKYQGGVLSSLLKLYNEGDKSGDNSGRSTPVITPNSSPPRSASSSRAPSPSPSRPESAPGSPKPSRPSSGFFGYHQKSGSKSSLALNELMKSTSTLVAPGSSGMSGKIKEKLKKEPIQREKKRKSGTWGAGSSLPKEKKKREDKIRITKHIAQILSRHKYLLKLCRALMMYGAPTHRLEEYMTMSARVLEIEGQFLYMPNCMIISFDDSSTHTTEVKIIRTRQGVDLGKLRDVHDLYKEVIHDRVGVDDALVKLDHIMGRRIKFNRWLRVPVYGLASACVAPFAFQGRFIDMPVAFLLGCILGFLQLVVAPSNEMYANVFEITAAIITSFLARAFGSINGGNTFCFSALAQSSIALILPGYMVLCSSLELQSHNLVAGSVRMVYAMIYTLFLGYGITIGTAIYGLIDRDGAVSEVECRDPLHSNWHLLFVPAFTLCLCVVNQAKWKQTPVMLAISLAGFLVNSHSARFFSASGNTQISNMLGALTVGLLANLYSRLGRHANIWWYNVVDWYQLRVAPRLSSARRRRGAHATGAPDNMFHLHSHQPLADVESRPGTPTSDDEKQAASGDGDGNGTGEKPSRRPVGYGLAAAAMLPAIFVQVPSGLAAGGSLVSGIANADQITNSSNSTGADGATAGGSSDEFHITGSAFAVLFAVIQVAIGITVGLFLSALIVYPLGKRRSGLLSF